MEFRGRDIFSYRVPRSGLTYNESLGWVLAAQWAGYRTHEFFEELDGDAQSFVVAAYQCQMQMEAVVRKYGKKK